MNTFNKVVSAIILSAGAIALPSVAAKASFNYGLEQQKLTKEYIVTFDLTAKAANLSKADFIAQKQQHLTQSGQITVKKTFKHLGAVLIETNPSTIAKLRMNKGVLSVAENRVIKEIPKKPSEVKHSVAEKGKNSSVLSWGIDRVDQRYLTLDGAYSPPRGGAGVTAYILDTGTVATSNEFDDASGQTRLRMGYNPFRDNFDSTDCHGHGSHVAGTVGGKNYGVAKDVNLVAVRVMECGEVKTVANIVEGMEWVINDVASHQGPAVVNMSLSDPEGSVAWDNATQAMIDTGITVVVAAGNNYYDACINSPARLSDAITVGATDQYDNYNNLSNYGQCVDILAPGTSVTSIDENGQPWTISGTSMAAPHVTGAAALVLERHPNYNHHQVKQYLLDHATQGVISGTAGAGDTAQPSANKLLYIGDDLGQPLPQPTVNAGESVQVDLLERGYAYYKTQIGADTEQLTIEIQSGDEVDLFVKHNDVPSANPVSFHNDCKQTHFGGNEVCEFNNPDAGDWQILIASSNPNASIQLSVEHDGTVIDICDSDPQSQECICKNDPTDPICNPVVEPIELVDGNPVTIDMASQSQALYFIDVAAGNKQLIVATTATSGNADLKVSLQQSDNSQTDICSSNGMNSEESCIIDNPAAGRYLVTLDAVNAVSDLSIEANIIEDSGCTVDCGVVEVLNLTNLASSTQLVYQVEVPANKTLTVTTFGGTGDAELLINYLQPADVWWASDCYSTNSGNDEVCNISDTLSGTYFIVLDAYTDFANVSLTASYQ